MSEPRSVKHLEAFLEKLFGEANSGDQESEKEPDDIMILLPNISPWGPIIFYNCCGENYSSYSY